MFISQAKQCLYKLVKITGQLHLYISRTKDFILNLGGQSILDKVQLGRMQVSSFPDPLSSDYIKTSYFRLRNRSLSKNCSVETASCMQINLQEESTLVPNRDTLIHQPLLKLFPFYKDYTLTITIKTQKSEPRKRRKLKFTTVMILEESLPRKASE